MQAAPRRTRAAGSDGRPLFLTQIKVLTTRDFLLLNPSAAPKCEATNERFVLLALIVVSASRHQRRPSIIVPATFIRRSTTRRAEAVRRLVAQLAVALARDLALCTTGQVVTEYDAQFKHRGKAEEHASNSSRRPIRSLDLRDKFRRLTGWLEIEQAAA